MATLRKLMITGCGGFVAGSVVWQALRGDEWDVCGLSRSQAPEKRERFERIQINPGDETRLDEVFARIRPDTVLHTAACADIDFCQNHQAQAEQANVGFTGTLATLCARYGAKMILCSTDTVFDGEKGRYTEDDAPRALNFYAETKIRAERIVRDNLSNGVVARLSLVMGLPVLGAGNSFLAKMLDAFRKGEQIKFPANEIRTPVDVISLGRALLELAENDFSGTLHLAGSTRLNRYEMACVIAEKLGYPRELVTAVDSNAMPGRAPRPNDASLDNAKARHLLKTPLPTLPDALELVMTFAAEQ